MEEAGYTWNEETKVTSWGNKVQRICQNPVCVRNASYFKKCLISFMEEELADNKRMEVNSSECSR